MKYGVREICNVVFRSKEVQKIGTTTFQVGQPVLYIDTAKTSTIEGTADTTYATGGRGNNRLMAWEGNKTMTFTVEDALISPIGLSILSGAHLFGADDYNTETVHVHQTVVQTAIGGKIFIKKSAVANICDTAPIYVMPADKDNEISGNYVLIKKITSGTDAQGSPAWVIEADASETALSGKYIVDFYSTEAGSKVQEIQIDPEKFAGYFYVEADTLFRNQSDGKDYPAQITIPNVKIQSAFNFSMSADGDPSTFTFTMDAFPGYTYFNPDKKVLCVIQVIDSDRTKDVSKQPVMDHVDMNGNSNNNTTDKADDYFYDSYREATEVDGFVPSSSDKNI